MKPVDDEELTARCLNGDGQAWEELVRGYRRLVFSVPLKMGLDVEQSEDVLQLTFLTLYNKLSTLRDRRRVGLWLAVTARRKALDRLRQLAASREIAVADEMIQQTPDAVPLADDQLMRLERQHQVRLAFELLPERCRDLLGPLFFDDPQPSYEELAARLNIPVGSLSPTRARCFAKLRKILIDRDVSSAGEYSSLK